MLRFSIVRFVRIIYFVIILASIESRRFKLVTLKCTSLNESFAIFKTCTVKAVQRDITELSIYAKLLQIPVTNVKMSILLRKRIDNSSRSIYEFSLDCCAFLRNKHRNSLAELFFNFLGLNTHSNLNHTCPYNHDIILDRYALNGKFDVLIPLPAGVYVIQSLWETDGIKRAEMSGVLERFFKLKSVYCYSRNESIIKFKTCELKPLKRDVSELSVYVQLLNVTVTKVKVSLSIRRRDDPQNRSLFQCQIDACHFIRNKRRNQLADLLYSFLGLKTHSNMNHTCPYNHDVYIERYTVSNKVAASVPIPVGSYGIYSKWEVNGVLQVDANLFIEAFDRNIYSEN